MYLTLHYDFLLIKWYSSLFVWSHDLKDADVNFGEKIINDVRGSGW